MLAMLAGLLLLLVSPAWAGGWQRLEGCKLLANPSNDGDSFHVEHGGREYIFRLYFVDCPESTNLVEDRVAEQAAHFRVSRAAVLRTGKLAAAFTAELLRRPFTVTTRFDDARGASQLPRYFAGVRTADGRDLAMLLAQAGLARAYGAQADFPGARSMEDYRQGELKARQARRGIFAGKSGAGSKREGEPVAADSEGSGDPKEPEALSITQDAFSVGGLMPDPAVPAREPTALPSQPSSAGEQRGEP